MQHHKVSLIPTVGILANILPKFPYCRGKSLRVAALPRPAAEAAQASMFFSESVVLPSEWTIPEFWDSIRES